MEVNITSMEFKMYSVILLTLTGILQSCIDSRNADFEPSPTLITLDLTRDIEFKNAQLDDLADHLEVIQLETTPESILRSIRAEFSENYILCLSGVRALLFNRQGHFLGSMKRTGIGADEYWDSNRWAIDETNNRIYTYNPYNSKLIRYYLDRRQVEDAFSTETNGSLQEMIVLNKDSIFAIRHVNRIFPYQYYYLSPEGHLLDGKSWDTTHYTHSNTSSSPFLQIDHKNRIIFQPSDTDTIFEIRGVIDHPLIAFKKKKYSNFGKKETIQHIYLKGLDLHRNAILHMVQEERITDGPVVVTSKPMDQFLFRYHAGINEIEKFDTISFNFQGLELNLSEHYFRVSGINSFYISIPINDILEKCEDFLNTNPEPDKAAQVQALQASLDINSNPLLITGRWKW